MANYNTLITAIQSVIAQNGNNEITGNILQQTLVAMIGALGGGYQFGGIATPETTPGTPDEKIFYLGSSGTYPNFGPAVIPSGNMGVFWYDTSWHVGTIAFPIGTGTITKTNLSQSLLDELLNGFVYSGVATPTGNPGTPVRDCFYMTSTPGTYTNFGGILVTDAEIAIIKYSTASGQWTKESVAIPELIEIADNLNTPDASKALSARMGYIIGQMVGNVNGTPGSTESILFSRVGYYASMPTGITFTTDTTVNTTPLIPLGDIVSILYTGAMGGTVATWFDVSQQPILQNVNANGSTLVSVDVMTSRPSGAQYVALSSRNSNHPNPPTTTPQCIVVYRAGYIDLQTQINEITKGDDISFSINGYYNATGGITTNQTNVSTGKIPLTKYKRLIYTGAGNGIFNFWDANNSFIGQIYIRDIIGGSESSFEPNASELDVRLYAPPTAAYVGVSVRKSNFSPAPLSDMSLVGYNDRESDFVRFGVIADGQTDTTSALQKLLYNGGSCINFPRGIYLISQSLIIKPGIIKRLQGNGAIIKVSQDVPAFIISGSLTASSTAAPTTLPAISLQTEASTIIDGFVITSTIPSIGTGIQLSNVFQPIIQNCYIHHINIGISIINRCRNIIIANNNIYCCNSYGLLFAQSSNCHQVNIVGNHISYCDCCVGFIQTQQTANVQIVGNDIEIDNWPTENVTGQRCIIIDYRVTSNALFSEFEIVGNTIQGHENSNGLIDISGVNNGYVENLSFYGNHVGNVVGYAIKLSYVHNCSFGGNTFRRISQKVYELAGTINGLVIANEICEAGTGYVNVDASAILYALTLLGLTGRGMSGGIIINCATINGLVVNACNIASNDLTIGATNIDYVSVTNNILRGAYSIAQCTHRIEANNI